MTDDPRLAGFEPPPRLSLGAAMSSEPGEEPSVDGFLAERHAARVRSWPFVRFAPRADPPWPVPQWTPASEADRELLRAVRLILVGHLMEWPFHAPAADQVRATQRVIDQIDGRAAGAGLAAEAAPVLEYLRRAVATFGAEPIRSRELYLAELDIGIMVDLIANPGSVSSAPPSAATE